MQQVVKRFAADFEQLKEKENSTTAEWLSFSQSLGKADDCIKDSTLASLLKNVQDECVKVNQSRRMAALTEALEAVLVTPHEDVLGSDSFVALEKAWQHAPLDKLVEDEELKWSLAGVADKLVECMMSVLNADANEQLLVEVGRLSKLS